GLRSANADGRTLRGGRLHAADRVRGAGVGHGAGAGRGGAGGGFAAAVRAGESGRGGGGAVVSAALSDDRAGLAGGGADDPGGDGGPRPRADQSLAPQWALFILLVLVGGVDCGGCGCAVTGLVAG